MKPGILATIYTDGAAAGKNKHYGRGGWAAIVQVGPLVMELYGGCAHATPKRMEMVAAIEGLKALKVPCIVDLFCDRRDLIRPMREGLAEKWAADGFIKPGERFARSRTENWDLWRELLRVAKPHEVTWRKCHAHSGDPMNERADELAKLGRDRVLLGYRHRVTSLRSRKVAA